MDVTGILKLKKDTEQVSDKFKKREFVITTPGEYPQHLLFQLTQDKCSLLDALTEGDEIQVFFNLRGREWKSKDGEIKYFNSLEAFKMGYIGNTQIESEEMPDPNKEIDNEDQLAF